MLKKTKNDRKQANIQGIHCKIKTTTGNRRWGLSDFFSRQGISFPLIFSPFYFLACILFYFHFICTSETPASVHNTSSILFFLWISTSHTSDHSQTFKTHHLDNLNTLCTLPCEHSGQRLQLSFVILLSCSFLGFFLRFSAV